MNHSFNEWLFNCCLMFVGGGIASLISGMHGCILLAIIQVAILITHYLDKEETSELVIADYPSVE